MNTYQSQNIKLLHLVETEVNFVCLWLQFLFWYFEAPIFNLEMFGPGEVKCLCSRGQECHSHQLFLWGKFGYNIFNGFKMARTQCWDAHFLVVLWIEIEEWRPLGLKSCHFKASEDIITKFKSQALHFKGFKYWSFGGSGNPPSLIPGILNIDILLHKQAIRTKYFDGECIISFPRFPKWFPKTWNCWLRARSSGVICLFFCSSSAISQFTSSDWKYFPFSS